MSPRPAPVDRRAVLAAGLATAGLGAMAAPAVAGPRAATDGHSRASHVRIAPRDGTDQTAELQATIDAAADQRVALALAPGRYLTGPLTLRPNSVIVGAQRQSVLVYIGGGTMITARKADGVRLDGLTIDGDRMALDAGQTTGLVALTDCEGVVLSDLDIRNGLLNGITLTRSAGTVRDCTVRNMSQAGVFSLDAHGLVLAHNEIADCANNGILVWRSKPGPDGTQVLANRIARIAAKGGGSGENGNGVNAFRAGGVMVQGNHITDCAYSAIRGNGADDLQMTGNFASGIGEVALYAEFAFSGTVIANNVVDNAASGISVTNFNEGGRLAVVQGNLIRNLFRRENEPVDKRGIGIGIEADAAVTGNVVDGAPTAGISAGWGRFLRDVAITGNLVRDAGVGILVSADPAAGACLVTHNMISGTRDGAIRAMDHGTPQGPDLASAEPAAGGRLVVSGNLAV